MTIEVIDRRGTKQKLVGESDPSLRSWVDKSYLHVLMGVNGHPTMAGRVVGLRSDGVPFTADCILPPMVFADYEWLRQADERLESFRLCSCMGHGLCAFHEIAVRSWFEKDIAGIQATARLPIPAALQAFIQQEQLRKQSRLIIPGHT